VSDASHPPKAGEPTLRALQRAVRSFRDARDWKQFHTLKDLASAISVEAAELQEHFLWVPRDDEFGRLEARRREITEELADVLIFCLHFADVASIDPSRAVIEKLAKNEERYPVETARGTGRKHGD
jgi:dCTP diphosphatase